MCRGTLWKKLFVQDTSREHTPDQEAEPEGPHHAHCLELHTTLQQIENQIGGLHQVSPLTVLLLDADACEVAPEPLASVVCP